LIKLDEITYAIYSKYDLNSNPININTSQQNQLFLFGQQLNDN